MDKERSFLDDTMKRRTGMQVVFVATLGVLAGLAACNNGNNEEVIIAPIDSGASSLGEQLRCTDEQLKQAGHERNDLGLQNGLTIITRHNEIDVAIAGLLKEHGMCLRMDEPMVADGYSAIVPPDKIDEAQFDLQQEVSKNTIIAVLREGKVTDFDVPVEITEPVERFSWFRQQLISRYGGQLYNHEERWIVTAGVDVSNGQSKQPREKIVSVQLIGIRDFNDYLSRIKAFLGEFDPIVRRKAFASGEMFLHPSGRPDPTTFPDFDQEIVEKLIRGETP